MSLGAFSTSLQKALSLHQAGKLGEARVIYNSLLKENATHPDALNLAGLLEFEDGDHNQAIGLIKKAIKFSPNNSQFHNNLGSVYASNAELTLAVQCFKAAIEIDSEFSLAYENLGNALMDMGLFHEAIEQYKKIVALMPKHEDGHVYLAAAFNANGQPELAISCLRKAVALGNGFPKVQNNLGILLLESGHIAEATDCFQQAIKLFPEYAAAYANLAAALWEAQLLTEAEQYACRAMELEPDLQEAYTVLGLIYLAQGRTTDASECILEPSLHFRDPNNNQDLLLEAFDHINKYKIIHDTEQLAYLYDQKIIADEGREILNEFQGLLSFVPEDGTPIRLSKLEPTPSHQFRQSFNHLNNFYNAPALKEGALNKELDTTSIEKAYHSNSPGFSLVDKFLSDDALNELRRFCLESTFWYDLSAIGDLGASLEEGFCCPLLMQIANEIRETFPSIYGEHYFSTCWSYRYFSKKSGDGLHGDSGRVSVNIWLTPDEANLEPKGGGLLFWNKKVPMLKVKDNPKEMTDQIMRDIIAEPDAESFSVPYKCNRATLFNSNIIHKTDEINFKPGYLNRRLNITFVFGKPEY